MLFIVNVTCMQLIKLNEYLVSTVHTAEYASMFLVAYGLNVKLQMFLINWYFANFQRNWHQLNVTGPYWWLVSHHSDGWLVPADDKLLLETLLAKVCDTLWCYEEPMIWMVPESHTHFESMKWGQEHVHYVPWMKYYGTFDATKTKQNQTMCLFYGVS